MGQLELHEDIGKGTFGAVKRVVHKPTGTAMAMKEIPLELDDSKLNAIIMEINVLHKAVDPDIIQFYGAFFVEGCVYYCVEYMDGGSIDRFLTHGGVPEPILACMLRSMVRGLKFLKDELKVMHRGTCEAR
jgi:mitogen-activated protein kinase kinase